VYMRLADKYLPRSLTSLNGRLVREVVLVSLLTVMALYAFIRISLARG
jgi:hypothetical protein